MHKISKQLSEEWAKQIKYLQRLNRDKICILSELKFDGQYPTRGHNSKHGYVAALYNGQECNEKGKFAIVMALCRDYTKDATRIQYLQRNALNPALDIYSAYTHDGNVVSTAPAIESIGLKRILIWLAQHNIFVRTITKGQ